MDFLVWLTLLIPMIVALGAYQYTPKAIKVAESAYGSKVHSIYALMVGLAAFVVLATAWGTVAMIFAVTD